MLSVILLTVVMLSVVMLCVFMRGVVAPTKLDILFFLFYLHVHLKLVLRRMHILLFKIENLKQLIFCFVCCKFSLLTLAHFTLV